MALSLCGCASMVRAMIRGYFGPSALMVYSKGDDFTSCETAASEPSPPTVSHRPLFLARSL